ncbi:undecaprenyl-phosphate glucose phosphotransferase, partial [Klebsiella pneumoniae]|nr:undecaprenyl-phosphate glucose phosphotransferase [Klebsiella pneumoniae]
LLIALGLLSLDSSIDTRFFFFFQWYLLVDIGFLVCRSIIRLISGLLRKFGYNTRKVAVVGSLPAGINLLKSFIEEPWLGFVVKGVYDNIQLDTSEYDNVPYAGNIDKLIQEARDGKIDRIYIAMSMHDESKIKDIVRQLTDTTCSVLLIPDI